MRPVLLAALLVLPIVAVPAHAAGPAWLDDDGSGRDAGPAPLLALPAAPGRHGGALADTLDAEDDYALDVPAGVVVRVAVEGEAWISALLVDDAGATRASASLFLGPVELSAAAPSGGAWTLVLRSEQAAGVSPQPYGFDLAYEAHGHFAPWRAPGGHAAAISVAMPAAGYVRLEASLSALAQGGGQGSFVVDDVLRLATPALGASFEQILVGTGPLESQPSLIVHRQGPADLDLQVPPLLPVGGDGAAGSLAIEAGRAPFLGDLALQHVELGVGSSHEVSLAGWLVWDDEAPVLSLLPATAVTLRASDLDGPFASAAGLATGDGLHGAWRSPGGAVTVVENALTPSVALAPTRLVATDPQGRIDDLVGQRVIRAPGFETSPPGTWAIDLRHTDGLEGDQPRFFGVAYGFPASA